MIELLGLWNQLKSPDSKLVEFDQFKNGDRAESGAARVRSAPA
jgi:hypothetical protein